MDVNVRFYFVHLFAADEIEEMITYWSQENGIHMHRTDCLNVPISDFHVI